MNPDIKTVKSGIFTIRYFIYNADKCQKRKCKEKGRLFVALSVDSDDLRYLTFQRIQRKGFMLKVIYSILMGHLCYKHFYNFLEQLNIRKEDWGFLLV